MFLLQGPEVGALSSQQGAFSMEERQATDVTSPVLRPINVVWARAVDRLPVPDHMEETLHAAKLIGDDQLQCQAERVPLPHSFTLGTTAQRARWFVRGSRKGGIADCSTIAVRFL